MENQSNRPEVSVIVPVYKCERCISRCIESILAQSFADFELILVDDGSPDACPGICDSYAEKDARVKVIHKKNGGVSSARNAGLDSARGEYVAFCDGDDYLVPDWLETLFTKIKSGPYDIVSAGFSKVDGKGSIISTLPVKETEFQLITPEAQTDYFINGLLKGGLGWEACTRLFKRSIAEEHHIHFCESCENYAEDLGFVLEYSVYCRSAASMDYHGYQYVQYESSMMGRSRAVIRLNAMNEISYSFGRRLESEKCTGLLRMMPYLHYLILKGEYDKFLRERKLRQIGPELLKIENSDWYSLQTGRIRLCRKVLSRYSGKPNAINAILISEYCVRRNPVIYLLYCVSAGLQNSRLYRHISAVRKNRKEK